jgi:hypothetical protein
MTALSADAKRRRFPETIFIRSGYKYLYFDSFAWSAGAKAR